MTKNNILKIKFDDHQRVEAKFGEFQNGGSQGAKVVEDKIFENQFYFT